MNRVRKIYRMRAANTALALITLVLLGLFIAPACTSVTNGLHDWRDLPPAPELGRLAPDFNLTGIDGSQVKLSELRGNIVFLHFWTTWCPGCRAELTQIDALYHKYKDKGVLFVGVDLMESRSRVLQFVEESGYSWTFLIDTFGEVGNAYRITGIPAEFILDADGVIRLTSIGAMDRKIVEGWLDRATR